MTQVEQVQLCHLQFILQNLRKLLFICHQNIPVFHLKKIYEILLAPEPEVVAEVV